ncbi:hypothetical protein BJV77DRAFT_241812 [Russula vinacea]|nr:hypothetical protein BJV77DRAFT_241812 [Russula vinacea]
MTSTPSTSPLVTFSYSLSPGFQASPPSLTHSLSPCIMSRGRWSSAWHISVRKYLHHVHSLSFLYFRWLSSLSSTPLAVAPYFPFRPSFRCYLRHRIPNTK